MSLLSLLLLLSALSLSLSPYHHHYSYHYFCHCFLSYHQGVSRPVLLVRNITATRIARLAISIRMWSLYLVLPLYIDWGRWQFVAVVNFIVFRCISFKPGFSHSWNYIQLQYLQVASKRKQFCNWHHTACQHVLLHLLRRTHGHQPTLITNKEILKQ